jgi:hypothetical protein
MAAQLVGERERRPVWLQWRGKRRKMGGHEGQCSLLQGLCHGKNIRFPAEETSEVAITLGSM